MKCTFHGALEHVHFLFMELNLVKKTAFWNCSAQYYNLNVVYTGAYNSHLMHQIVRSFWSKSSYSMCNDCRPSIYCSFVLIDYNGLLATIFLLAQKIVTFLLGVLAFD